MTGALVAGLIDENLVGHEEFLAFVHDIDRSSLAANPALAKEIAALMATGILESVVLHESAQLVPS